MKSYFILLSFFMCITLLAMEENREFEKKALLKSTSLVVLSVQKTGAKSPLMRCKSIIIEPEKLDDNMIQKVKEFQERTRRPIVVKH